MKVIRMFRDLHDSGHLYRPGDTFPRDGLEVSVDRIKALASTDNLRGEPLIVEDEHKPKSTRKRAKKDD